MYKIDAYSVYQQSSYNSIKKNKADETKANNSADKLDKADKLNKPDKANDKIELSKDAKALLEELKKKYGNMDFMVANYETEEEAADILSRGTKEFSVLIDPDMLEKMANDDEYKDKQLKTLEEATGNLKDMTKQLGDKADDVKHLGISIDSEGKVTYFAELEKMSEKQRERIEKSKADKKDAKAEAAKKEDKLDKIEKDDKPYGDKHKKAIVKADSAEGLLDIIKNFNWDEIKEKNIETTGGKFDFSA